MLQMYTIFVDDSAIHITESEPEQGIVEVCKGELIPWIDKIWTGMESRKSGGDVYLVVPDAQKAWDEIQSRYTPVTAAGGMLRNDHGEVLFICRLGKWDLPKGKMEDGESPEICALREVEEECGITGHSIVEALPDTYHVYALDGKKILKRTHWFVMHVDGRPQPTPQAEEDISEAKWRPVSDWENVEENTYPSVRSLLETYRFRYK